MRDRQYVSLIMGPCSPVCYRTTLWSSYDRTWFFEPDKQEILILSYYLIFACVGGGGVCVYMCVCLCICLCVCLCVCVCDVCVRVFVSCFLVLFSCLSFFVQFGLYRWSGEGSMVPLAFHQYDFY
jgi:hypothetical protein